MRKPLNCAARGSDLKFWLRVVSALGFLLIFATAACCAESDIAEGVMGMKWKDPPTKASYPLTREEKLGDVESYCPTNIFNLLYNSDIGEFKVFFEGMPYMKPVFWFYKKQFAELEFYDLDSGRSLLALCELYGPPTRIIENGTPEGLQRWDKGEILIDYVRFENDKAGIWFKHKGLWEKIAAATDR